MLCFYLEDFVVNAIIESEKINGTRKVLIKNAYTYGEEVIKILKQKGYHAQMKTINERAIQIFEKKFANYFISYKEGTEKGYLLKENINIEELKQLFRKNFTPEIISIFSDNIIVTQTLNINKYSQINTKEKDISPIQIYLIQSDETLARLTNIKTEIIQTSNNKPKRLVKNKKSESSSND